MNIIIAGDFNDFSCATLEEDLALKNKVNVATRMGSILDKIFMDTDLSDNFDEFAVVGPPVGNSDHNSIFLRSSTDVNNVSTRCFPVWDFRESNVKRFLSRLSTMLDSSTFKTSNSVNDMCSHLYESIYSSMCVIPYEMVTLTSRDKPWITPLLKLLLNKRWDAFRRRDWPMFYHYKSKVKDEIVKAKKFWANRHRENVSGLWKVVKEVKGSPASDPFRHIRQQFANVGEMVDALTRQFEQNFNAAPDVDLLPITDETWNFKISENEVLNELLHLNTRKGCGPDNVPSKLLKIGAYHLCGPLCNIYNKSIQTQTFPDCFKIAYIQPIPKNARPTVSDFRPISMTTIIGKLFERLVLCHMKESLCRLYGPNQHAYRPFGSTTSALIDIHNSITSFLDKRETKAVRIMCLDISKAFDNIQFNRLLNFLNDSGIDHGFLKWLKSYLSDRFFQVRVNGVCGESTLTTSGVPQGSVLGPFLFASFMSSIEFESDHVHCVKYADDITIIERIESVSQQHLSRPCIERKIFEAGFTLNVRKCQEIFVRRSNHPLNCVSASCFSRVVQLRILGFIFTDSLSWNAQISDILKRASQRLYIIRCLKNVLSTEELIIVFQSIIGSLFLYASPAYGNLSKTLLLKFERFQNRAHRIICGRNCDCDRFRPISSMFLERGLQFLQSCELNSSHPLHYLVPKRLPKSNKLMIPFSSTARRQNAFLPWYCCVSNGFTSI